MDNTLDPKTLKPSLDPVPTASHSRCRIEPTKHLDLGGLAPGGSFGTYHPDGFVRFAARLLREWEFMATGTGVIPVLEMLLQEYPDKLIVLPCWPEEVPVRFALYSPYAGRVEVNYRPDETLTVNTDRPLPVESPRQDRAAVHTEITQRMPL